MKSVRITVGVHHDGLGAERQEVSLIGEDDIKAKQPAQGHLKGGARFSFALCQPIAF